MGGGGEAACHQATLCPSLQQVGEVLIQSFLDAVVLSERQSV